MEDVSGVQWNNQHLNSSLIRRSNLDHGQQQSFHTSATVQAALATLSSSNASLRLMCTISPDRPHHHPETHLMPVGHRTSCARTTSENKDNSRHIQHLGIQNTVWYFRGNKYNRRLATQGSIVRAAYVVCVPLNSLTQLLLQH